MTMAWLQAKRLGHATVEPEHVLLGLAEERDGVAGNVLKNLGASYKRLEEFATPSSPNPINVAPWSEAIHHLIEAALEEAYHLNHNYIGTEHLLLAVCRLTDGSAQHLLAQCGMQQADVRLEVLNILGHRSDGTRMPP
jgi:ATP-dependent Clp protease ATP-binding subunit ClpC